MVRGTLALSGVSFAGEARSAHKMSTREIQFSSAVPTELQFFQIGLYLAAKTFWFESAGHFSAGKAFLD